MTTKRGFLLALAASTSISAICPALAEVYPARPITIVVPFPAGGPMDTVGRILAEPMRASLGKPLTIENVARCRRHHRYRPGRASAARWFNGSL